MYDFWNSRKVAWYLEALEESGFGEETAKAITGVAPAGSSIIDMGCGVGALTLRLAGDREASIPKAISWVLREHTRNTAPEVAAFLDEHAADLPAIAVRETRNKLRTGFKAGRPPARG